MVLAAMCGVHHIGSIIDVRGTTIDVQWWGRYGKGRFHPSWLDEDDDELFLSDRSRDRKVKTGADLSVNWTEGLTADDVVVRGFAMRAGRPPPAVERLIGTRVL